jgi:glycoside/pentoside/hexuronide:cation symporter, GPH family
LPVACSENAPELIDSVGFSLSKRITKAGLKRMSENSVASKVRLGVGQRVGFGVADFGFNLYYTGLNLFLLYYYTDVLGIRPAVAGLIFAIPLFWDAVTDPVMGMIASRTRSRFGSYRPYILFGAVPLALSFVLMFAAPLLFPSAVVAVSAAAHILFRTCYTVVSVPYSAMSAKITQDSGERGALAGVRILFAATGGLFTVFVMLPFAARFGGGDMKVGFFYVSVVFAVIATALFMTTFKATRERVELTSGFRSAPADLWRYLYRNRALLLLISAIVLGGMGGAIFGKALVYYVLYVAGLDISVTLALITLTASVTLGVPIWMAASRWLSKRMVWLLGAGLGMTAQLVLFAAPPATVGPFLVLLVMLGIGNAAFAVTFWSMLPDTVEYGQFRSGVRDEGLVFGLNQLALKAATGLGIGLLGFLLEAIGYVANEAQAPDTVQGLRLLSTLVPFACSFCAAALIAFYPVDKPLHARLVRAIDWRNRKQSLVPQTNDTP